MTVTADMLSVLQCWSKPALLVLYLHEMVHPANPDLRPPSRPGLNGRARAVCPYFHEVLCSQWFNSHQATMPFNELDRFKGRGVSLGWGRKIAAKMYEWQADAALTWPKVITRDGFLQGS